MQSLNRKYSRDAYQPWLEYIKNVGKPVDVRGRSTLEVLDGITEIEEPWHHCILLPSRRWNPWLALSEALWILAGRNDVSALAPYNSHISDYSDNGSVLYGAYGARMYAQIDDLVGRLRKDPSDRRAVLSIWKFDAWDNTESDLTATTKDPPCNNLVYFKLRDNKLHMTVICRSNDLHFGLFAVNLPTFGILQSYIAARLGVDMGTQTHLSNSLHIYTDDKRAVEITDRMLYEEDPETEYPEHEKVFTDLTKFVGGHQNFASWCNMVLDNKELGNCPMPFLVFAKNFLTQYRQHKWRPDDLPFKDHYSDWVLAGQIFTDKVWK